MPLFSIIVPVYNVEEYLSKCLTSIFNQTFTDYEVIVVDDGSTDSSSSICDSFSNTYSNYHVIHKSNGGIVSARQTGVKNAKGEYIVCVDGDDYIDRNYLLEFSKVIDLFQPDTICCDYYEVFENRFRLVKNEYPSGLMSREKMVEKLFPSLIVSKKGKGFAPQLWAKAFKRDIYQQQQLINTKVVMGEDVACTKPTIANSNSLFIIDKALYYYRQNPKSVSNSKKVFPWDGPKIRGMHLLEKIKVADYDFSDQIYRDIALALFTVCRSRFYSKELRVSAVKKDILANLDDPFYNRAVLNSKFSNIKLKLIVSSLKHKWFWFMRLYNKFKR